VGVVKQKEMIVAVMRGRPLRGRLGQLKTSAD
jgi:hypothetical protein